MMDLGTIAVFTGVAALLVMSPGPNGVLLAKTVPVSGKQAGFANIAGFVVAFYLHGTLAVLGISLILMRSAELYTVLKLLGAAYLCWIGIRAMVDAVRGKTVDLDVVPRKRRMTLVAAFFEGVLTNALNPKVSLFYLAAFPQFLPPGATAGDAFLLVFIHSVLNLVWFGMMVLVLSRMTAAMRGGAVQRWIKGITGVVFLGFGARLATSQP